MALELPGINEKKKKNSGLKPSRLPLQISMELKTNIESNRVPKKEVYCIEPNWNI